MLEVKKARGASTGHGPDRGGPGRDRAPGRADRRQRTGHDFPDDPREQLWGAIAAVFRSWDNERAKTYRKLHHIPDDWGTAVNVQAMVFGNLGDDSATGVAFTRDPATRRAQVLRRVPPERPGRGRRGGHPHAPAPELRRLGRLARGDDAQGLRRAAAGARAPREALPGHAGPRVHDRGRQALPAADPQRQADGLRGRAHRDRHGRRGPHRRGRGGRARRARAARAAARADLRRRRRRSAAVKDGRLLGKGLPAGPGAACGRIALTAVGAVAMAARGEPVVLVREETSPEDIAGMHAAAGILTTRGGTTSHAAVVARGMGKTCIVGARRDHRGPRAQGIRSKGLKARGGGLALHRRHDRRGAAGQALDAPVGGPAGGARGDDQARGFVRLPRVHAHPRVGRRAAPPRRPRQRRHAQRRPHRARLRRRGDRPLPHGAHVLRGRTHHGRARDDPRRDARPAARRRSPRSCPCSARTSSGSSARWAIGRSRSGCSTRPCTSSCRTTTTRCRRSPPSSASRSRRSANARTR